MEKIKFFDGGMGTMLQADGLKPGELPELLNLTAPEKVAKVHKAYAEAGSDIISTNTFGANSLKFDNVEEIVSSAVSLAKSAGKMVALDIGPTGKLLKPLGELSFEDAYEVFKKTIVAAEDKTDIILLETMTDLLEIKAAVLAAKENSKLPVFVSMMFDDTGRLLTGTDIRSAVVTLEGLGVDAIGMNCGLGPEQMYEFVRELRSYTKLPILVNPNAGLPESVNGNTVFNVDAQEFAECMERIAKLGVSYLGGCCGTTPEHIRKMIEACGKIPSAITQPEPTTAVCSYSKTVELGTDRVIIGERINPTGKKLFKEALRRHDINYIVREGVAQKEAGAHILDVNIGLPEIDEPSMMKESVLALQSVIDLPLQIDTSDPIAMETALRCYNGKAMLNSVNGKDEVMKQVFPLAKKYGAVVVCLCLDESGIPETADGRIEIARKIIETAKSYGIPKNELVFDALAMTVSTGADNANQTIDAVRRLNDELGVKTVLGVSNISFGLPNRDEINSTFFAMALQAGLSAGIINPMSEKMMNIYYSFRALKGLDDNCGDYITKISAKKQAETEQPVTDLKTAIIKGIKNEAAKCAEKLIENTDSLEIINGYIIPALDFVGDEFEAKRMFLPQLLMSADSAKAAFDVIKARMTSSDSSQSGKRVILATVHGDIHDIGKNIVKVLLENYGFDVIDLGKDVPPEKVLEETVNSNTELVGLSALMTTTVPAMEETIKLIHENTDAKVMVGGAVLTKSYADMINADFYAKDAAESVKIAKKCLKI
ncbi:MAG: homocysteine S-methyltransferase family protein [Clostridia bacterium]|nr:homocysteine S-methyltransferase family protein [Clostridia bacterium]